MDAIKIFLILIILSASFSCTKLDDTSPEDCSTYDFLDCNRTVPTLAEVSILFTHNATHKKVPFKIFKGYIDDGDILLSDTSNTNNITFYLPVNQYYTVEAEYIVNNEKIKAIDGYDFKNTSTLKCDSTCWSTNTKILRVNLK